MLLKSVYTFIHLCRGLSDMCILFCLMYSTLKVKVVLFHHQSSHKEKDEP